MGTLIFILITVFSVGLAAIAALLFKKRSRVRRMSKRFAKKSGKATFSRMKKRSLYANRRNAERFCPPACRQSRLPKALCRCQAKKCSHGKESGVWGLFRFSEPPDARRHRENVVRRTNA